MLSYESTPIIIIQQLYYIEAKPILHRQVASGKWIYGLIARQFSSLQRYNTDMQILYMVTREIEYPRNEVILRALQRIGDVEVLGVSRRPISLLANSLSIFLRAVPRLLFKKFDLVFVGFYGHLLMLPVGILVNQPVLFDAFLSTYDTLSADRENFPPRSIAGRLAFWLDRAACLLASQVLLDTSLHVEYFIKTLSLPVEKFNAVPVGCNEDHFFPRPRPLPGNETRVLYYSTYMPLHGVEIVVQAAVSLRYEPIRFRLIGKGPTYQKVKHLADDLELENIEFVDVVPLQDLPGEITCADICLGGHFGLSDKASRVIPGKIYQILAMAAPLIAADTPANQVLLQHKESAYLCPPGDPEALALAISKLHGDRSLREHLARGGRQRYLEVCSEAIIRERLRSIIDELIG